MESSPRSEDIPLNAVDRHVGARIHARRILLQMSEDQLAGLLGVSRLDLERFEEGTARIPFEIQRDIARVLGVPDRYFYLEFKFGTAHLPAKKDYLRDVDRWFITHLFPYERELISVARRVTGDTETARDLVQHIYAEILTGDKWKAIDNPRAYAMKALRNRGYAALKRAQIVPIDLVADMESLKLIDPGPRTSDVLFAKEKRDILLEAIERLPPQARRVVKMRRFLDLSQTEIAQKLGISLSAVGKLLARGMLSLTNSLAEYDTGVAIEKAKQRNKTTNRE